MNQQSYRGYGLPDAPRGGGLASPADAIEGCIEAARDVLGGTFLNVVEAPWHKPTFRSRQQVDFVRGLINVAAATDANANTGGTRLIASNNPFSLAAPYWVTGEIQASTDFVDLWTIRPNPSEAIVIQSWGITIVNNLPEVALIRLQGNAVGGMPSAPDPSSSGYLQRDHQPVNAILTADKQLTVRASLRATTSAVLIYFSACYYRIPVLKYKDSPESLLPSSGFGVKCKP